ncbi:MAG: hypothetical protein KatS3mg104_1673 [Phycisphaerae bacterium]|nr:MAG: hypothetical protein KatS3mg104_1673 [Phycisphaerae bacterium]
MEGFKLATRQIHLDFHTGPWIPGIGSEFDADTFGDMMKDANVNSVTVFAKCHHGHLYYNTRHPARHPGLQTGFDLLGRQIEALHKRNIRAPIYISVQCDEFAANTHPEWVALRPDGTRVGRGPLAHDPFTWQILDMSSPYQEYLYEQVVEVLETFKPVDGIFFDMCWDQRSVSNWAKDGMKTKGYDPGSEEDRVKYAHDVAIAYMKRFSKLVKQYSPKGSYYFNSRPLWNLAEEAPMQSQIEIEALPTGGWGVHVFSDQCEVCAKLQPSLLRNDSPVPQILGGFWWTQALRRIGIRNLSNDGARGSMFDRRSTASSRYVGSGGL